MEDLPQDRTVPDAETVEPTMLEKAYKVRDEILAANKQHEALIVRQEKLKATEALGGRSEAGAAPAKKETENDKWAREAKERYAGTGLDPTE